MSTRAERIKDAAQVLAIGEAAAAQMTPREQAEAAWEHDSIATVDELETLIRQQRAARQRKTA